MHQSTTHTVLVGEKAGCQPSASSQPVHEAVEQLVQTPLKPVLSGFVTLHYRPSSQPPLGHLQYRILHVATHTLLPLQHLLHSHKMTSNPILSVQPAYAAYLPGPTHLVVFHHLHWNIKQPPPSSLLHSPIPILAPFTPANQTRAWCT